ncbi:aminopeptidase [Deinococcus budaensis]|uniref:Putative aminopeptidase n=1 Tax=Deinococcus budaensis TaxID=1665626 RepID=A0A7W8LQU9_9DEIO|nr:aminopeptidase [Deinococcus budaensis]MBB5234982.1 putative aminopeptidase [Deinococcus budaensis]
MKAWVLGAGGLLALALVGCGEVGYLTQAAAGQLDLLVRARPVAEVLADPATPPETRRQLALVQQVRAFAVGELGLPDRGAYRTYVDVGRPSVVWNVFRAPEFGLDLLTSCFPVAGCVGYRGYFREADARAYAQTRRAAGEDVRVGGVTAYSTLGYLRDPVLSTMLASPDPTLIRTVIHELAHPAVYVPGDTVYNESFATAVEEEGWRRWMSAHGTPELEAADRTIRARARAFEALLLAARAELQALYAQPLAPQERRTRKAAALAGLQDRYAALKASWGGYGGYDAWFAAGVNNAALASAAAYAALVPDFTAALGRVGADVPAFLALARACGERPPGERASCLREETP